MSKHVCVQDLTSYSEGTNKDCEMGCELLQEADGEHPTHHYNHTLRWTMQGVVDW